MVASKGKKGFGWRSDPGKQGLVSDAALGAIALSGFGNSLANSANAAGSIVTAGAASVPDPLSASLCEACTVHRMSACLCKDLQPRH